MKLFGDLFKKSVSLYVELRGREAVLAEGYCRIESYSHEIIVLASDSERIAVRGAELTLRHLSRERVAVEGRIDGIEFV